MKLPEKEIKQPGTAGCVCVELLKRSKTCTHVISAVFIYLFIDLFIYLFIHGFMEPDLL